MPIRGHRTNVLFGGPKFPSNISTSIVASGELNSWRYARYAEKVDLTKVSKVRFNYTIKAYFNDFSDGKDYYDSVSGQVGVSVGNSGAFDKSVSTGALWYAGDLTALMQKWLSSSGTLELDVSNLTGEYYIGCGSNYNDTIHYDKSGQTNMTVTGVTFIK